MRNVNPAHCSHLSVKSLFKRATKVSRADSHDKWDENIYSLSQSSYFYSDSLRAKHLLSNYSDCV